MKIPVLGGDVTDALVLRSKQPKAVLALHLLHLDDVIEVDVSAGCGLDEARHCFVLL